MALAVAVYSTQRCVHSDLGMALEAPGDTQAAWKETPDNTPDAFVAGLPTTLRRFPAAIVKALVESPCFAHLPAFVSLFKRLEEVHASLMPPLGKALAGMVGMGITDANALDVTGLEMRQKTVLFTSVLYQDWQSHRRRSHYE